MTTSKEEVLILLKNLPENVSMDEIVDAIYVREKIKKGLDDLDKGKTFTQEEIEAMIEKW